MTGNVSEWVKDWYHDNYEGAPTDGSAWEEFDVFYRVLRGSSWDSNQAYLRMSRRSRHPPDTSICDGIDWKGFRCARDQ
jgi:formylglycine-generating enzyme required for sulfatase activity